MGFDVLVFESDFYGLSRSWELAKAGQADPDAYRHDVYPLWANCSECSELFRYIDSHMGTEQELTVAGADPKPDLRFSSEYLLDELDDLIEKNKLMEDVKNKQRFLEILEETMANQYESKATADQKEFFLTMAEEMGKKLERGSFWHQELKSLAGFVQNAWDPLGSNNFRDTQMGDNMMWLINQKFEGRKVIFWGSNSHIFKNFGQIGSYNNKEDTINTGTYLHQLLQEDLYVLGFTSHHGTAGRLYNPPFEIHKPWANYFESWIYESRTPYAFIDFRQAPFVGEERNFWMKAILHQSNLVNWFNLFDGIFYIEEMNPCSEEEYWWRKPQLGKRSTVLSLLLLLQHL